MTDNLDLWQRHDRLQAETEEKRRKLNKVLDMAIEGVEIAINELEDGNVCRALKELEDLIEELEDKR